MSERPRLFLILVGPEYEDLELWYPKLRLEEAGFIPRIAGLGEREYRGKYGYPCRVDGSVADFLSEDLAGILVPGGWAPDKLRREKLVLDRVRALDAQGRVLATICHGGWVFASAGILRGRRMTSTVGIRDDLVNAGATWIDQPVVVDRNLVSAQLPKDLPAFGKALVDALA